MHVQETGEEQQVLVRIGQDEGREEEVGTVIKAGRRPEPPRVDAEGALLFRRG
jgi:hypothetical protein